MTFERKSANWVNESQTLNEGQHTVNLNTMEVRAIYFALFHMKEEMLFMLNDHQHISAKY